MSIDLTRRGLFGAGLGLAGALGLGQVAASAASPTVVRYGTNSSQFGELTMPSGTPRGIAVVIHGGFWRSAFNLSLGRPLAADLASRGWVAWNIEYRRVGNGGGNPNTFDDVSNAIAALKTKITGLDTTRVVTIGHSAGGHLATWAAARQRFTRWTSSPVPVTHVISQAGVLDLTEAHRLNLGSGAVRSFMGTVPGSSYDPCDPYRHIPLTQPVWAIHGTADTTVPISQSQRYVDKAVSFGAAATLVANSGNHMDQISTTSTAWAQANSILDTIG